MGNHLSHCRSFFLSMIWGALSWAFVLAFYLFPFTITGVFRTLPSHVVSFLSPALFRVLVVIFFLGAILCGLTFRGIVIFFLCGAHV